MAKFDVYDENIPVNILRNGQKQTVPFKELVCGDVISTGNVVVAIDAHFSTDPSYDGWLLFDQNGIDYYPEDFGAERNHIT